MSFYCGCLFCRGENGKKLKVVPFGLADAAGLIVAAKKEKVTIKPTDNIFVIEGVRAVACVRIVRRRLARLCGCWVDREFRGQGIGSILVRHRIAWVEKHTSAFGIDTFAFRPKLFLTLGFQRRKGFKIGTTLLRKVIAR